MLLPSILIVIAAPKYMMKMPNGATIAVSAIVEFKGPKLVSRWTPTGERLQVTEADKRRWTIDPRYISLKVAPGHRLLGFEVRSKGATGTRRILVEGTRGGFGDQVEGDSVFTGALIEVPAKLQTTDIPITLIGDRSTPLGEFAPSAPSRFKHEFLKKLPFETHDAMCAVAITLPEFERKFADGVSVSVVDNKGNEGTASGEGWIDEKRGVMAFEFDAPQSAVKTIKIVLYPVTRFTWGAVPTRPKP